MQSKKLSLGLTAALTISALTLFATGTRATAQQETILHSFPSSSKDGDQLHASLIMDAAGNLYGTTLYGGAGACPTTPGCGLVFELTPKAGGGWTEKILHTFGNGADGYNPLAGLIFDAAGNLYGTTTSGGTDAVGTVFELSPKAGGIWTEKILHNFLLNGTDGAGPEGVLIFDTAGNLYGTTAGGGAHGYGTVFELTHSSGGGWAAKVLHSFNKNGIDGYQPESGLTFDAVGNLYGTTPAGGVYGVGTAFVLKHSASGWTEKNLHNFNNNGVDGYYPYGCGLTFDAAGHLYGTTTYGGAYNYGTAYELTLTSGGSWNETVLYNFNFLSNGVPDGLYPFAGVIFDANGNLYGTLSSGGVYYYGAVFKLTPVTGGAWTENLLYSFSNVVGTDDGAFPLAGLTFDASGNLYGTTSNGGAYASGQAGGTVFELTP